MSDDDFDDFFDSPGRKPTKSKTGLVDNGNLAEQHCQHTDYSGVPLTSAKPPAHPSSRPSSGKSRLSYQANQFDELRSKRVIEAKLPSSSNEYDYDEDEFDDDGDADSEPTPRPIAKRHHSETDSSNGHDWIEYSSRSESVFNELEIASDEFTDSDGNSEVTIVSPLHSPVGHQSQCEKKSKASDSKYRLHPEKDHFENERKLTYSKHGNGVYRADSDKMDLEALLKTVLDINDTNALSRENRPRSSMVRPQSAQRSSGTRRNYSFTNEQTRAIDRENERLMKKIMKHAADAKKAKTKTVKSKVSTTVTKRPSSSAINRMKQLQKIESENLMLLSRLQHTKPSRELQRETLVDDFDRRSAGSRMSRPASATAAHVQRFGGSSVGQQRVRPGSSNQPGSRRPRSSVDRRQSAEDNDMSRPGTVFANRIDDDDVLTWEDGF